jgi:hypothetical protein
MISAFAFSKRARSRAKSGPIGGGGGGGTDGGAPSPRMSL